MREFARISRICFKFLALWQKYPDFRFFQVISLIQSAFEIEDTFYLEDNIVEETINFLLNGEME